MWFIKKKTRVLKISTLVGRRLESVLSTGTSRSCAARHLLLYPRSARVQGTRWAGEVLERGQVFPLDQTGQQGARGPATKAFPDQLPLIGAQGCGHLQLGLQADTGLTSNPALLGCLAPRPFGIKSSQCNLSTSVAFSQPSSLPSEATTGQSLRKSKR